MMDGACWPRCAEVVVILLFVQASLALAEPRAKAELGRGGHAKIRAQTSVMVAGNRRSFLRRHSGAQASPPVSSMSLADYKMEISRKMNQVRTPMQFLQVFFPAETVMARWTNMVNESVQNAWRAGRTEAEDLETERPTFTAETARILFEEVQSHGKNISCGEPKPVLIDMYEELNLTRGAFVYLYPECTLVKRCEGSGCCSGGAPCVGKANTRENISRPFMFMRVVPESRRKESRYIRHSLYADTECVCKESPLMSQCPPQECPDLMRFDEVTCCCVCTKRCPKPYQRDDKTCDCKCADKDGGCNKIKRARRRLPPAECSCVMADQCLQPSCKKGYVFDTRLCKCTQTESSRRRENNRNNRHGRTDTQLPYPSRSGRTDVKPSLSYGSESEPPPGFPGNKQSSESDNHDDQLLVTWDSEDVTQDCHRPGCPEPPEGVDTGSGAHGD